MGCGGKVGFEIGGKTEKCVWCIVRKGVEVVARDSATAPNGESISQISHFPSRFAYIGAHVIPSHNFPV